MRWVAAAILYIGLWVAWALWGWPFLQVSEVFGGSYWVGLPDRNASISAWLVWPVVVLLVYILPVALASALPVLARGLIRHLGGNRHSETLH
jgi:hypothetical protein